MLRWVCALVLCLGADVVLAEDSLLGLPTPRDPQQPGAVLLHGGGSIKQKTYDRFWELAGARKARIVLVPCAKFRPADYDTEEEFLEAVSWQYSNWVEWKTKGWVEDFQFLYTDDPDDADDPDFCRALESATGVWFSGGAQSRLNYRFVGHFPEQTRFQKLLREVLRRGGVVGGTSAGMAALPEVATLRQEQTDSTSPASAVAAHGLGLFDRAIVEQHFDGKWGRFERFAGLLRDNDRLDRLAGRDGAGRQMVGIAVDEGTALVAQGNRLEVLGRSSVHLFLKSNAGRTIAWHELGAGEQARLEGVGETVTLVR